MNFTHSLTKGTGYLRFILLCLLLHVSSQPLIAQRSTRDINRVGDEYFALQQYYKATLYYLESLNINPKDEQANFQMGECSRFLFNYPDAEHYYGKIVNTELSLRKNPKALYYYALVQKLNGKYDEAIRNFSNFIEYVDTKQSPVITDEEYAPLRDQARVDKEGCILALKQLTHPFKELNFKNIGEPVNSEAHDYAASVYRNDETIVITSGRKGAKGDLTNQRFGESFTDNYRFGLEGNQWSELKEKDDFDKVINTKWGDGAGVFNAQHDKFYFTRCNENDGADCHIYLSELKGGKWSEPRSVGRNINVPGYSSKQPALTHGGDTLFFNSNRPGGIGGTDIWMSVSSGRDNWGPAINLGDQINTILNEISPYYSAEENALFFASDGHRGFGGFDIYMARGYSLFTAEVYNLGPPFNSNRDDSYYYLGQNTGFLSSNRKGGSGGFDLYRFNIITRKKIIAEIDNADAIAGRNSLYSDDYEFDAEDPVTMEKIMSRIMANRLADSDVPLSQTEILFYDTLSDDDQGRMDRIVNSRIRNLSESDITAMRDEDDIYYQNLAGNSRERADHIIDDYLNDKGFGTSTTLASEDERFYENLPIADRQRLDRVISYKVADAETADAYGIASQTVREYENLDAEGQERINRMAAAWVAAKADISANTFETRDRNYYNSLGGEEKKRVEQSIQYRIRELFDSEQYGLDEEAKAYYQQLSEQDKMRIDRMADAFLRSESNNLAANLNESDVAYYRALPAADKSKTDRILVRKIRNISDADRFYYETLSEEAKERIDRLAEFYAEGKSLDQAKMQLSPLDQKNLMGMSPENAAKFDRLIVARSRMLKDELPVASGTPATASTTTTTETSKSTTAPQEQVAVVTDVPPAKLQGAASSSIQSLTEQSQAASWKALGTALKDPAASNYYNTLSAEEKKQVQHILDAGLKKMSNQAIDYYIRLSSKDKERIHRLAAGYLETSGVLSSSQIATAEDQQYYAALSPTNKALVDEVLLSTTNNLNAAGLAYYQTLSPEEKRSLARLAAAHWNGAAAPEQLAPALAYYRSLEPELQASLDDYNSRALKTAIEEPAASDFLSRQSKKDLPLVARITGAAMQTDGEIIPANLTETDRRWYEKLNPEEKTTIQNLVNSSLFEMDLAGQVAYIEMGEDERRQMGQLATDALSSMFAVRRTKLPQETKDYYISLGVEDKVRVNRMIANGFARMAEADKTWFLAQPVAQQEHIANLIKTYGAESKPSVPLAQYLNSMPIAEKSRVQEMVTNSLNGLKGKDKQYYNSLPAEEKDQINRLVLSRYLQSTGAAEVVDDPEQQGYYAALPADRKERINQLVETVNARLLTGTEDLLVNDTDRPAASQSLGLNSSNEGSVSVTYDDLEYYKNLDAVERKTVDRLIAYQLTATAYEEDPKLFEEDKAYYKKLDTDEKERITRISRNFHAQGEVMHAFAAEDTQYYENLPPEKRSRVNRLVVLLEDGSLPQNPPALRSDENKYLQTLNTEEKLRVNRIATLRQAAARITGDDIEKDLSAIHQEDIAVDVQSFDTGKYNTITVSGKLIEIGSGKPAAGVEIPLANAAGEVLKYTTTNKDGSFRYVNLPADENYRVLAENRTESATEAARFFIKDLEVSGTERISKFVQFENIYFDLNEHSIRPEAKNILNELVTYLKAHPNVQVEINAYTDRAGSDAYNLQLSRKRGQAAFDYLVSKGIDRTALIMNSKGKASPVASNNSEYGRQLNRRVEFILFGDNINYNPEFSTYIVKPGGTMYSIAKAFGMTTEQIRQVNGMVPGDILAAYEPLRLRIIPKEKIPEAMVFPQTVFTGRGFTQYTVKQGETLSALSQRFGISKEVIVEVNGLDSEELRAGQVIQILSENN